MENHKASFVIPEQSNHQFYGMASFLALKYEIGGHNKKTPNYKLVESYSAQADKSAYQTYSRKTNTSVTDCQ